MSSPADSACSQGPEALASLWVSVRAEVGARYPNLEEAHWLQNVRLTAVAEDSVTLLVPTRWHGTVLVEEFSPALGEAFEAVTSRKRALQFEVDPDRQVAPVPHEQPTVPSALRDKIPEAAAEQSELVRPLLGPSLNPDYTFERFVVGSCNQMAHAAAQAVSRQPGKAFNPVFFHGTVGVGKTHLLQGICHEIQACQPELHIATLSCERFLQEFVTSLKTHQVAEFQSRYREVDVLVIDDIHLLTNKKRTQEEFFNTFNVLHDAHKQVVLSSDAPPEDIPDLQDRLVSRFKWGLVAELTTPGFETRLAILQSKAEQRGIRLPDEVAQLIAERVDRNVRELEGCVNRLAGFAMLSSSAITMEMAQEHLRSELRVVSRTPGMDDIFACVTERYSVKVAELQSKRRQQRVVVPRQVAMHLARCLTCLSLKDIGGFFGDRDHTTVMHACSRVEKRMQADEEFAAVVAALEEQVRKACRRG